MKEIIKKWWFWLILLGIIIVIGFTIIMMMAFNMIKGEVGDLAIQIQNIYEDATIYASAGNNTLILELDNWNNNYSDELSRMIEIVKNKINNNELKSYSKFVTLAFIENNGKENALLVKTTYNIPEFTKNEEESKPYILFDEYQKLFDTYDKAMEGYTGLFNSIY